MHVENQPEQSRFVLLRGDEELGEAVYQRSPGVIEFTHTVIDEDKRERGMGSVLVGEALNQVRESGDDRVVATCPFVARFIEEHPEHQGLLER